MKKSFKFNRRSTEMKPNIYLLLVAAGRSNQTIVKSRLPAKVGDMVQYVLRDRGVQKPRAAKVLASWHIYDGSDAFNIIDSIVDGVVGDLFATKVWTPKYSAKESLYPHCELESIINILSVVTAGEYSPEFLLSRYAEMVEDGDPDLDYFIGVTLDHDW